MDVVEQRKIGVNQGWKKIKIQEASFKTRLGSKPKQTKNLKKHDDPLKWFNRFMFLFGFSQSDRNNGLERFYHRFHGFMSIIHAICTIITGAVELSHEPRLYKWDTLMYCSGRLVYNVFFHSYGHVLYKWIKFMSGNLSSHERKRIQMISFMGLILIFTDRISFTFYSFHNSHVFEINDWIFSFQVNYIIHSFTLYVVFLALFYFSCKKLLDSLNSSLNPLLFNELSHHLRIQIRQVNQFAAIPFLILLPYIFIALPATVSESRGASDDDNFRLDLDLLDFMKVILMFVYLNFIVLTVIIVIVLRNKLESKRMEIMYNLVNSYKGKFLVTVDWEVCIERLYDEKLFDFSVFSLFSLDFSLLMTYSFAVITFSIFLFEMDNNIHKNNKF